MNLGNAYNGLGEYPKAIDYYQQSLKLARELKNSQSEGILLVNIGAAYNDLNNYPKAIEYEQQSLAIIREINDRKNEEKALLNLGNAYYHLGEYPKAIDYSQQSLKIAKERKNPQGEGKALSNLSNVYLSQAEYDKAIDSANQALMIARKSKDLQHRQIESYVLNTLGSTYLNQGKYSKAIDSQQQSLAIAREIQDHRQEFTALNNLGNTYEMMGDSPQAIKCREQSLEIAREIPDRQSEGIALQALGHIYSRQLDYQKAMDYQNKSLAIAREVHNRSSEGKALGNLGFIYLGLAEYSKAIDYHNQYLAIARETKDHQDEGIAFNNLGTAYRYLGEYSKAIECYQKSWAIAHKYKDPYYEGEVLNNLGDIYRYLGEYSKAINKYYLKSLQIAQTIKNPVREGITLNSLGDTYYHQGDYHQAIGYYQKSLQIAQTIKNRGGEVHALGGLGNVYWSQGDYTKAINYLQQSLTITRETRDRPLEGAVLGSLGNVYSTQGDYRQGINYLQQSLTIIKEIKYPYNEGNGLHNLGYALYKQGNFPLAETTLFQGIKVLESLRDTKLKDPEKVSFFDTQSDAFVDLQNVIIAEKKKDLALEIAERGRARALVDLLAKRESPNNTDIPSPPTTEQIKQIAKQQNATLVEYSIIYDDFKVEGKIKTKESKLYIWVIKPTGEIKFHQSDLTLLHQKNSSLATLVTDTLASITSIPTNASAVSTTRGNNQRIFKEGDRVKLKDDFPKDPAWIVIAVNADTLTLRQPSHPLGQTSTYPITDVVEKIGENGSQSSANAKDRNLKQLHQLLIEPIAKDLPSEEDARVIFIPQQELFAVPFPALQDPQGKYLIEKHTILTAPSIQVLELTHQQRQRVPGSAKDVLLVGNPIMPKVKPGEQPLSQLKGMETEVKAIAPIFQVKPIIGKDATKLAILPILPKARIIHFATHGRLDNIRGLGSAIALAPSGNDNGWLTAEEIFKLKLNAELVVISACNTGQGRITGDGVIGLSRSLMNAGVPSIVVSLWSVPDKSTTTLMTGFYRNLQQNKLDKARSLRKAMQTMIQKDFSPYDWAAFTLIGNAE